MLYHKLTLTTFGLDVKDFVVECMTLANNTGGPTSPTLSEESDVTVDAPHAVSTQEQEQAGCYYGITADGDQPELLYRTTSYRTSSEEDPWVPLTGRHANMPTKSALPAHDTQLSKFWGTFGPKGDDLVHVAVKRSYSVDPALVLHREERDPRPRHCLDDRPSRL